MVVDRTSTRKELAPILGQKCVILATVDAPTLVGATDTLTMTLANFGISKVLAVQEFVHTTANSVIVAATPTTTVASGVLTIVTSTGNDNCKRVMIVIGE